MTFDIVRDAAEMRVRRLDFQAFGLEHVDDAQCLADDLGTDAIAGKYCDLHAHQPNSQGCSKRRCASNVRIVSA